ncbi:MAG TPA: hypothetical protein ENH82_07550 [bacterium]|nr:hypothetical protein [bacterium]
MRAFSISLTMDDADPDGICLTQTPGGSGNLTINGALQTGGVATMDVARHVSITSDADESGDTYTITGTDRLGLTLTETITGPDTTITTGNKNFLTVTQVATSGAGSGNITVGSADEAESKWAPVEAFSSDAGYAVTLTSGADLVYQVEYTLDDVFVSTFTQDGANSFNYQAKTTASAGTFDKPMTAVRLAVNTFANSGGTATLRVIPPRSRQTG